MRALRRHHRDRMRARSRFIMGEVQQWADPRFGHDKWFEHWAIRRSDNFVNCSRACCGNPRHHVSGPDRITRQERANPWSPTVRWQLWGDWLDFEGSPGQTAYDAWCDEEGRCWWEVPEPESCEDPLCPCGKARASWQPYAESGDPWPASH